MDYDVPSDLPIIAADADESEDKQEPPIDNDDNDEKSDGEHDNVPVSDIEPAIF